MIIKLNNITLDVDIEKTKQFYAQAKVITDGCSCDGCRNFMLGTDKVKGEILDFFSNLGIDIQKPAEIMSLCAEDNGETIYYEGWYHICGKILTGNDCWTATVNDDNGTSVYKICDENLYHVSEEFAVGFSNNIALQDDDFPMPIIQMEIFFHHFPWVLNEPNKN